MLKTRRSRWLAAVVAAIAIGGLVAVLLVTRPWLAFIDVTVNETLPAVETPAAVTPGETAPPPPTEPTEIATGEFISHEHETTGTVRIVENADGTRLLAIENLSTTNGPDVNVWLSASDVVAGPEGWFIAGGQPFVDLGSIKGNLGNQVYEIPAGVDLEVYRSVALWCVQFGVSFGAAQLV